MLRSNSCPDCGANPINHQLARAEVAMDIILEKLFRPLRPVRRQFEKFLSSLPLDEGAVRVIDVLCSIGIARMLIHPLPTDSDRIRVIWEAAEKRDIQLCRMSLFGRPTSIFVAKFKSAYRVYSLMPRPAGPPSESYDWMDNKRTMIEKFQKAGIPVPKGDACLTYGAALSVFKNLGGKVIAKPILGSHSRHTFIGISTPQQLARAFYGVKQISPWVIIEQQLAGLVYRPTIIGGRVVGVLRREPAHVMGDGRSTIRQLVEEENKNSLRQGPTFFRLPMDAGSRIQLSSQGLGWDSVPPLGQMVVLNEKVARREGASNTDVTDEAHPENIKLFEKIGAFLGDPLVGIDFIIGDIAKSWHEQPACGVIECNAMPFIDLHHFPLRGKPRDAAGALWDIVFPEAAIGK
jgi:D-alanine-D-alanine ligase-like ATP-grasp enzyme